ncbi:PAS domain-containing protein [Archangium violaceum]|uniref:ATP-binding protein n=1 Tax=Archangium violaceum TaxID=83451 RepID=UPI00193BFDB4|nr:ATP-binding protein [Archangium violaceum]QRK11069.1 PAS domain-containing protein [Archangium violaceum]
MSALADLLETNLQTVVRRWMARVQERLAPGPCSEPALKDHIEEYLQEMIQVLRQGDEQAQASRRGESSAAEQHGEQRFQVGFDVESMVREYDVLRECLLELVEESNVVVTPREVRLLSGYVVTGIAEAVREFVRQRDEHLRQAEAARSSAVESERALLNAVLQQMPLAVIVAEPSGRMVLANPQVEQLIGHPFRAAQGVPEYSAAYHGFHLDGRPYRDEEWPLARAIQKGEVVPPEEMEAERADGTRRALRLSGFPVRDAHGHLVAGVTMAEDITERRRLEAERQRAVEVLEHGDAVFVVDRDFRLLLANRNQERITHTRREDTLGRVIWETFPAIADPKTQFWREYRRAMEERVEVRFEEYYAPVGVWTSVSVYPTAEGGIAVFFRDVTEQKHAEERLRQASEFEQQLIGIVSHDLRNPLNAILLSCTALLRHDGLDATALRTVTRIQASAERASRLIRDLLDLTRGRLGGGIPITRSPVDLRYVVDAVVEEMEAAHPSRRVVVHASGDLRGNWDAQRLSQLLGNLLKNALDYSPEDSPVEVVLAEEAAGVRLEVRNRGEPIPPESMGRLFEPFQRGGGVAAARPGLGLGLYIVRLIVDAHGGTLEARSTAAEGSVFTVRLPRRPPIP